MIVEAQRSVQRLPPALVALLLALALSASGCLQLGHIQTLRASQDRFSELAALENEQVLGGEPAAVLARDLAASNRPGDLAPGVKEAQARKLLEGYRGVYRDIEALKSRADRELRGDDLYGSAALLSVLAYWRMAFYAHLAGAEASTAGREGSPEESGDPPSLVNVRALATAAEQATGDAPLFPRDRYLLKAIPALVRYDIAYLKAIREARAGRLSSAGSPADQEAAKAIIDQIAKADQELDAASRCEAQPGGETRCLAESAMGYALLARYRMLGNAYTLAAHVKILPRDVGGVGPEGGTADASRSALPQLLMRSCDLRHDVERDPLKPLAERVRLLAGHAELGRGSFDCPPPS